MLIRGNRVTNFPYKTKALTFPTFKCLPSVKTSKKKKKKKNTKQLRENNRLGTKKCVNAEQKQYKKWAPTLTEVKLHAKIRKEK